MIKAFNIFIKWSMELFNKIFRKTSEIFFEKLLDKHDRLLIGNEELDFKLVQDAFILLHSKQ